ncbi:MAG: bL17 family ribosomal protein [Candidatus Dojkabacteria bacterium]
MYKGVKTVKLGRKASHRSALKQNLLRSLLERGHVVTTTPRAKVLKRDMESLIEKGKKNSEDISFVRKLQLVLGNEKLTKKFVEYVKGEKTGVTLVKIGFRAGDNAEKTKVSLVGIEKKKKTTKKEREVEGKEEKKETKEIRREGNRIGLFSRDKKVDTTSVVKHTERARTRSGL